MAKKSKTVFGLSFGFDLWGLLLFAAIMIPNFIWMGVSAPNDVLRRETITPALDLAATVFQVISVCLLVLFVRRGRKNTWDSPFTIAAGLFLLCYIIAWIFYYCGFANIAVILSLALTPCLSLLAFEWERRNDLAIPPTAVFAVLHLISACINYL